jgi:PHD/YefM family antitoxin component YafN of YafNO toxin-antitoxin module
MLTTARTVSTIGVRELAKHASAIINDIEQKKEPALVTRRGRPVVYMLPVDSAEFEDFVLAHAPQFIEGMAAAGELVGCQATFAGFHNQGWGRWWRSP